MGADDAGELSIGSGFDREFVDLALSVNAAVLWSYSFADHDVTWVAGMDSLLDMPGAADSDIRARLHELLAPVTTAASTAPIWEDLELEQPFRSPTGDERIIRLRARRYGDVDTGGLIGVAVDVTRAETTSRELADLADRYRLLVELSPDAICVHQDGVITYVNPAGVSMIGADSDARILGSEIVEFVDMHSLADLQQRLTSLDEPGATSEPSEAKLLRFGGGTLLVEAVSVRTTWEGRPAFQVIMRDITAQREAEATLHYQAALVEHVSDAIIATTSDGVVTSWNPAAEQVYGVRAEDARGCRVSDVVGATLDPAALHEGGGITRAMHRRADGSVLAIRVSAAAMDGGYVLMCADETALRRAEQHYSTVVAALDEGVMVVGPSGLIVSANPAAQDILGVAEGELIGASPASWALFDEDGGALHSESYPALVTQRTGEPEYSRVVRVERGDGQDVWLALTCRPLMPDDRPPHTVVASFTDISESRAIRERLEREATHDPLTGLGNRTLVLQRLGSALCPGTTGQPITVLFIDLDNFKVINDSLGHAVGDDVLRIVGERLQRAARAEDLVGRLGGDEFVVVTHGDCGPEEIRGLAEQLRDLLTEPIDVGGRRLHVDASIGIVFAAPGDTRSAEDVLRDADVAMYQAKGLGRGRYMFFDVELRERMQRHMQLEQDLRGAVRTGQFWLAYQPVVDLRTDRVVAVEGLLRWRHPVHGAVSPGEFIPVAEESNLINRIGDQMLREATREFTTLCRRYGLAMGLKVNLSARQLEDPALISLVRGALADTGMSPQTLCFEITESALMRDSNAAVGVLNELRDQGVFLAIDDFGTGYSSLAQLQRLPLDTLKIDRSFVSGLGQARDAEAIVTSVIAMAHAVDLTVVAEGVETAEQLDILRRLGCDQVQGFYLGRPAPIGELFDTIRERSPELSDRDRTR